ncbi:hypothetical protein LTR75_017614 [Friedmanniomyces endolithicus]|nr:hypothetical protein LTR75_017614 [Friedmanniomyces endolithicus]
MGVSRPKPDFTVGLRRTAFQNDELRKLENYATPQGPFYLTPDFCSPFLMCEAKTGRIGIDQADTQNIHSASIAVRAMFKPYYAAYGADHDRTKALTGQILTFSVSHNNRLVNLYGHYAIAGSSNENSAESLQFFRHDIAMFGLTMYDGRERYNSYNFIRNLYDKFGPEHLRRIQDAVGQMPSPAQRTGLSFAASDMGLDRAPRSKTRERPPRRGVHTSGHQDSVANQEQKWNIFFADPVFEILVVVDTQLAGEEVQLDEQARVDHRRRNLTGKGEEVQTVQRTKAAVAARCVQV